MAAPQALFRAVKLPTPGTLYLHSMPGSREPFADVIDAIAAGAITRVVCLTSLDEIRERSPMYFQAINQGLPWTHDYYPIVDRGVPEELPSYTDLARKVADALKSGAHVLVHCAAGIGRTGSFAMAVALDLGLGPAEAHRVVREAGSWPETSAQEALIAALGR